MAGYGMARKAVVNGVMRRMRSDIFLEGERDLFIEWVL